MNIPHFIKMALLRAAVTLCLFVLVETIDDWHFSGPNIALRRNSDQYPGTYMGQNPNLAVDGYTGFDQNLRHCSHTTMAQYSVSAYWRVHLGDFYHIAGIRIYNRDDSNRERLRYFIIEGQTQQGNTVIYTSKNEEYMQTTIDIPVNGQYVVNAITIRLPPNRVNSFLTLCEVEVFALGCPGIQPENSMKQIGLETGSTYNYQTTQINTMNAVISILCKRGFFPTTQFSIQCQPDRTYNATQPYCSRYCGNPPLIVNGHYMMTIATGIYPAGSIIFVKCNEGFTLDGSGRRTCNADGTWSGSPSRCRTISCRVPNMQNGHFVGSVSLGSSVSYQTILSVSCDTGYEKEVGTIECRSNGQWTNSGPYCRIKTCAQPGDLIHGYYTYESGTPIPFNRPYVYKTVLIITCLRGYQSNSTSKRIMCSSNGLWSSSPICKIQECVLPSLANGYFTSHNRSTPVTSVYFQDVVYPYCSDRFEIEGDEQKLCLANGTLSGGVVKCVSLCRIPDADHSFYVDENGNHLQKMYIKQGRRIFIKCNPGFDMDSDDSLMCKADHTWSRSPNDCKGITCKIDQFHLNTNNITSFPKEGEVSFNKTIQLQCKEGFEAAGGHQELRCGDTKQLEGDILRCNAKRCNLSQLPQQTNNIIVNYTESFVYFNTTVLIQCKDGFGRASGLQQVRCNEKTTFDGDVLLCHESKPAQSTSMGTIAGIGGGCAGILIVIVLAGLIFLRHRRSHMHSPNNKKRRSIDLSTINTSVSVDDDAANEYSYVNDTGIQVTIGEDHVYNIIQPEEEPASDEYYSFTPERLPESAIRVSELTNVILAKDADLNLIKEQFESFTKGMTANHIAATKTENRGKNKYRDMYAYDKTRVVLQPGNLKSETDYINACYINGFSLSKRYIAAQAPFELTLNDFWRMIWQTQVSKIVMLTKLKEEEKVKCEQYWPKNGTEMFGRVKVTLKKTEQFSDFIVRTIVLSKDDSPNRTVTQFHFTAWPDKGVPKYASSLVHFRQKAMNAKTDTTGPVVVHCSAGVGRTGTFIALDILVEQGKRLGYVDVKGCVQTLRKQRVMMVQTLEQYTFIHMALIEALMLSPSVLPAASFISTYKDALEIDPETRERRLDSEFEMLRKMSPAAEESQYISAVAIRNRRKNRYPDILPVEEFMPSLKDESGVSYINAVFLPSYRTKSAFIITQTPLEDTQAEFWRLVFDHNVHTIVMMNSVSGLQAKEIYWPQGDDPITHDNLKICLVESEVQESHNILTMEVTVSYKKRKIKLFQYCYQATDDEFPGTPESFLTLMELVQYWQQQTSNNPVVVHCMNGVDKSGLYCVISSVIERLKVEQDVAISQTIEVMRNCREQLIPSVDQFQFCHDVVLAYINQFETYSNFTVNT